MNTIFTIRVIPCEDIMLQTKVTKNLAAGEFAHLLGQPIELPEAESFDVKINNIDLLNQYDEVKKLFDDDVYFVHMYVNAKQFFWCVTCCYYDDAALMWTATAPETLGMLNTGYYQDITTYREQKSYLINGEKKERSIFGITLTDWIYLLVILVCVLLVVLPVLAVIVVGSLELLGILEPLETLESLK